MTLLSVIEAGVKNGQPAFWLPGGRQLCVADGRAARDILWNRDNLYKEHSDFFNTRHGALSPRRAQIEVGANARAIVESGMGRSDFAQIISVLGERNEWPSCGNRILFEIMHPLLASASRPKKFHDLLRRVVETRIYCRSRWRYVQRVLLRRAFAREFSKLSNEAADEGDLLAAVIKFSDKQSHIEQAMHVYVSLVFALVGSLGFALGWALYLAAVHDCLDEDAKDILSESLRLYPIAWLQARHPAMDHTVLGHPVTTEHQVMVSAYAVHRNPSNWERPDEFIPGRWREPPSRENWLPFGAGPHGCIGVGLTFSIVAALFEEIRKTNSIRVHCRDPRPGIGPALRPPRFILELRPLG